MRRSWVSSGAALLGLALVVVGAGCSSEGASSSSATSTPAASAASATGKVVITYDEAGVRPENLEAFRIVRADGGLDRVAAWLNERLALPTDIKVVVTDEVPVGVTDASAEADGRTVWEPAFFLTELLQTSRQLVPAVQAEGKVPSVVAEDFTPEAVMAGFTEFIFGHEMGHALTRVLDLPVLSLEEIQADGMAAFLTLNVSERGPVAAVQTAAVFDAMAAAHGTPTVGDYSSDHPVIQSRIYNFLCWAAGSDVDRLRGPLIGSGFIPEERAMFCPLQWAQLDHGWWRALEPHLSPSGQELTAPARAESAAEYARRYEEFKATLDQIRAQAAAGG